LAATGVATIRGAVVALALLAGGAAAVAQQSPPAGGREAELEERLRRMEEANRAILERYEALEGRYDALARRLEAVETPAPRAPVPPPSPSPRAARPAAGGADADPAAPDSTSIPRSGGDGGKSVPLDARFGNGFELLSDDGEFQLQFHNETQVEARIFEQPDQDPVRTGFFLPRQRIFFNGRMTRKLDYMVSINRGFREFNVLDAFANYHPDDRFQIKLGRYMTPFNYEQYAVQNMWLINPERSLFTANYGLNRNLGLMIWGVDVADRVDYAVGIFNGPRNSFEDQNDAKDVVAYVNARPFHPGGGLLKDLNLGGSLAQGSQDDPGQPTALRVATNASNAPGAASAAPAFLVFNNGVIERGDRRFGTIHLAYFGGGLSVLAEWDRGRVSYADGRDGVPTDLPVSAYSVAVGTFLTGERPERRTIVEPLRPFNLRHGEFSPGAIELAARYSFLEVGDEVFTAGLADPALWSDQAYTTDVGFNWYPNRYLKFYFDWQHAVFGSPVQFRPGASQLTSDLFWLRMQLYF